MTKRSVLPPMLNLRQIRTSKNDNLCGGNWIAAMPIQCRKGFRIRFEIFKNPHSLKTVTWAVWAFALLFLVAQYCAGGVHHVYTFNDYYAFNDYVLAGYHWIQGEYLYGNWRGFIYSPIVAAFFAPLSILPSAVRF